MPLSDEERRLRDNERKRLEYAKNPEPKRARNRALRKGKKYKRKSRSDYYSKNTDHCRKQQKEYRQRPAVRQRDIERKVVNNARMILKRTFGDHVPQSLLEAKVAQIRISRTVKQSLTLHRAHDTAFSQ